MSFFKQTTDIDLGDTAIENIFINDFMPMADGVYVKVYLLAYKYACDKEERVVASNVTIARHLNVPLYDVLSAWDFWEKKGIIKKHPISQDKEDYQVEFLNLKQLYIKNNYKPIEFSSSSSYSNTTYSFTPADIVEANKSQDIQNMFYSINQMMGRSLVPNEMKKILEWLHNYTMTPDMIVHAVRYSLEKRSTKSLNYIGGIIRNWYDNGITTVEKLEQHLLTNGDKYGRYSRITRAMGVSTLYEGQREIIDKWFDQWKMPLDVILLALKKASATANPNINFFDSILETWYRNNLLSEDKILEFEKQSAAARQQKPVTAPKKTQTKFHNFEQRSSKYSAEELEKLVMSKKP
jgi:DnaD/phage-associated family protein